jgi:hypothetical protein
LSQIFKYYLLDAPKLLALSQQNTVSEGFSFRLLCSIQTGSKPLFFQWSKNGQILSNSPQTNYKIENSEDQSIFKILNVIRTDSGNYSCTVRNAFGSDSQSAMLLVKGLNNFNSINIQCFNLIKVFLTISQSLQNGLLSLKIFN